MNLGFVFTNFNNSKVTRDAVQSIYQNCLYHVVNVVIVDNKSEQSEVESLMVLKRDFSDINIIINDENLGYFKGLNVGLKFLKDHFNVVMDLTIIGNNDLIFQQNFFKSISLNKTIFEKYPVISPNLITLDGIHQNPHVISKISRFRELIYDLYYTSYLLALIINQIAKITKTITDRDDEMQYAIAQQIYQGYGACYILSPLFFKHFDQLWAPTFLMGEELFLSKQLEDKSFKVFYEPSIIVSHQCHATMSKMPRKQIWSIAKLSHKTYRKYVKIWD